MLVLRLCYISWMVIIGDFPLLPVTGSLQLLIAGFHWNAAL